jgi:hypothetical protein
MPDLMTAVREDDGFALECIEEAMAGFALAEGDRELIASELMRLVREDPSLRELYSGAHPRHDVYETGETPTLASTAARAPASDVVVARGKS